MNLYENWVELAYDPTGQARAELWDEYMPLETALYQDILTKKRDTWEVTVSDIAEEFNMTPVMAVGFIDGIHEALEEQIDVESLEEDSSVTLKFDYKKLFLTMVEYRAEHLVELSEWDDIFTKEEQKEMYQEKRNEGTVVKEEQVGRNDPCPCGSGRKYKHCCGRA